MAAYKKAYIYFDTNALECRHSGKSLYLSQFTVSPLYYEIEELIRKMGLVDKIEICIPDIVWLELQEHLIKHFKVEKSSMEAKIISFRKSFGNLAEIACEFKDCHTESEYSDYAHDIAQNFLDSPRVNAKLVPCPKDEETVQQIIHQAVHSVRPFKAAKAGGKEYTDAGFKDALIFNTIISHTEDQLGVFISNDNDFAELFDGVGTNNFRICNSAKEVQAILSQEFNVVSSDMIEVLLNTDDYLIKRILSECEFEEDSYISGLKIVSCETMEDNVGVKFIAMVNGIKNSFDISYNMNANELLAASCELFDERGNE